MVGKRCCGGLVLLFVGQLRLVVSINMHAVSLARSHQSLMHQGEGANNNAVHRPPPVRVSPEAANAARASVTSFEAAISALGNADGAALKFEGPGSYPSCPSWGLEACTQFIERARKRLEKSDLELEKIQAECARLAAELADRSKIGGPHSTTNAHGRWQN